MNILHIINSLDVGGAENALVNLISAESGRNHHRVVSLTGLGAFAAPLQALGVEIHPLDFRRPHRIPAEFARLVQLLRRQPPQLVQTWMYHADVVGGLACRCAGRRLPLVWGVRLTEVDPAGIKRTTRLLVRCAGLLSRWLPDAIIANAAESIASHAAYGYDVRKFHIVGNGFDTQRFRPDDARRQQLRRQLAIADDRVLVGLVGRYSTQKNQDGFLAAAGKAAQAMPSLDFVLCGRGIGPDNQTLAALSRQHQLDGRLHLLPEQPDVETVFAGLDVYASASRAEGFPNVVAEAMACGVPCVVTDVGNCRELVGDSGIVCPSSDPAAMAAAIGELAAMSPATRAAMGQQARQRIKQAYSREQMLRGFEAVWDEVAGSVRRSH